MDEILYQSKSQKKRIENQLEAESFIKEKKIKELDARWEDAKLKAATMQSVLDYMAEQFYAHKDELPKDLEEQTREQLGLRASEIKEFIMGEKQYYIQALEEYNKTI
jgi:hypothetical protein